MPTPTQSRFAPQPMAQSIVHGPHTLLADVAAAQGGADQGPDPHALVAAALCACTGMTLRMVAARRSWPLTDVQVTVTIAHVDGETHIARTIALVGPLDAAQRDRLLATADRCPIHLLLHGTVRIATQLA